MVKIVQRLCNKVDKEQCSDDCRKAIIVLIHKINE